MSGITSVLALAIAILVHTAYKSYTAPPRVVSPYERYFSEDYYDARRLFRENARFAKAELHTIPYPLDGMELSIDVAILPGASSSSLVVHLSGTHGVEGFAGSAIQSALLANETFLNKKHDATIAFVHAVNPYGFAKLRRYNEHNVDLNRNHLTPEQFEEMQSRDPNRFGYTEFASILNPVVPDDISFWTGLGYHIATKGYVNGKRAVVAGTYHDPKGLFYGGHELEPSHRLLHEFFRTRFDLASLSHVAFIDVHTGLGPSGVDTLDVLSNPALGPRLFPGQILSSNDEGALSGYDGVVGYAVPAYAATWFPESVSKLCVLQEFGTVSSLVVLRALRAENAYYHHDPTARLAAAQQLRDVFYLHDDGEWKHEVVARGMDVLETVAAKVRISSE
ncbi:hypothetical protein AeNC1_015547 [Aphanomyces euteiches]|nr:hypothetical protein AeNC1_015547 [Aphanomyces euteiches]